MHLEPKTTELYLLTSRAWDSVVGVRKGSEVKRKLKTEEGDIRERQGARRSISEQN